MPPQKRPSSVQLTMSNDKSMSGKRKKLNEMEQNLVELLQSPKQPDFVSLGYVSPRLGQRDVRENFNSSPVQPFVPHLNDNTRNTNPPPPYYFPPPPPYSSYPLPSLTSSIFRCPTCFPIATISSRPLICNCDRNVRDQQHGSNRSGQSIPHMVSVGLSGFERSDESLESIVIPSGMCLINGQMMMQVQNNENIRLHERRGPFDIGQQQRPPPDYNVFHSRGPFQVQEPTYIHDSRTNIHPQQRNSPNRRNVVNRQQHINNNNRQSNNINVTNRPNNLNHINRQSNSVNALPSFSHVIDTVTQRWLEHSISLVENALVVAPMSSSPPSITHSVGYHLDNYEALLGLAQQLAQSKPKGLSKQEIDQLALYHFNSSTKRGSLDQKVCVVCQMAFENRQRIRVLVCEHEFHSKCIDKWLKTNRTCPICRADAKNKANKSSIKTSMRL